MDTPLPPPTPTPKRGKKALVAAIIACIVAAGALGFVGGFFYAKSAWPSFFGFVFVNEAAFPDDALRSFVAQQVDTDGNGIITPDENNAFTQFNTYNPDQTVYQPGLLETTIETAPSTIAVETTSEGIAAKPQGGDEDEADNKADTTGGTPDETPPAIGSLAGLEHFTNLQALICPNIGLAKLDLAAMPQLRYVDCRGNAFGVLDLSNNKALECLYCDDDVRISGIDQAGLYCDSLLTRASAATPEFGETDSMTFSYDAYGRMVEGNGKTYLYNAQGMLSGVYTPEAERDGVRLPAFTDEYTYAEETRTMKSVRHGWGYDGKGATEATIYSYEATLAFDDAGRLVGEQATVPTRLGDSLMDVRKASYAYEGDTNLVASTTVESSYAGTNADKMSTKTHQGTNHYTYTDGRLANRTHNATYEDGEQSSGRVDYVREGSTISITSGSKANEKGFPLLESTTYDDRGYPAQTVTGDPSEPYSTITYECTMDGYITKASWDFGAEVRADPATVNRVVSLEYVKHVGSASYERLLPTLPSYVFASAQGYDYIDMCWQPNNGLWFAAIIVETDPLAKAKERTSLVAGTVHSGMRLLDEGPSELMWPWRINVLWTPAAPKTENLT